MKEQGYNVYCSQINRIKYQKPVSIDTYKKHLDTLNNHLWIVGIINGKVAGYISGYAVNKTAHIDQLFTSTEDLKTNIVTGLYFYFVQVCRRSEVINEVNSGLHFPEVPSLCNFKQRLGFNLKYIPAKVRINPILKYVLKIIKPNAFYRLTGFT